MSKVYLIGLGNPGEKYKHTRHNIAFMLLDMLQGRLDDLPAPQKNNKLKSKISQNDQLLLLWPQTYMNESGQAARALLNWYKIQDLSRLLVIHDEISLPLGQIRWSNDRGAGGHHGIESIIQELGGRRDFRRLRLGIGPDPGGMQRASYVLAPFPDQQALQAVLDRALASLLFYLEHDLDLGQTMNLYNG